MTDFVMPTSPADIKKVQDAVKESYNSMVRISAEKDLMKDIAAKMKEELGMPPSLFNRMVKTYFKSSFTTETEKAEEFADVYESLMAGVDPDLSV